jgi:hypothetical protein
MEEAIVQRRDGGRIAPELDADSVHARAAIAGVEAELAAIEALPAALLREVLGEGVPDASVYRGD